MRTKTIVNGKGEPQITQIEIPIEGAANTDTCRAERRRQSGNNQGFSAWRGRAARQHGK